MRKALDKAWIDALELGIPLGPLQRLAVDSAFAWLAENTTLNLDPEMPPEEIPANVKMFIIKFVQLVARDGSVTSQSIEGLSQSFNSEDIWLQLRRYAQELFGAEYVSDVRFIRAVRQWQ